MKNIVKSVIENDEKSMFCRFYFREKYEDIDYSKLIENSKRFGYNINKIIPGKRKLIAIMFDLSPDLFYSFLGSMMTGNIPSIFPINSVKQDKELFKKSMREIIELSEIDFIMSSRKYKELFDELEFGNRIIYCEDFIENGEFEMIFGEENETAFLQHSSGTTGLKKGVMLTHGHVIDHVISYSKAIGLNKNDKIVSWLPLYHDMGFIACFIMPMLTGIPVYMMDTFDWLVNPRKLLEIISREKASLCWLPNFAYLFMAERIKESDLNNIGLSSIRAFINCSEPITKKAHERFYEKFARTELKEEMLTGCYGMAENVFAVTQTDIGQKAKELSIDNVEFNKGIVNPGVDRTLVSSGKPILGTKIKILDDNLNEIKENRIGQIAISGNSLFNGYYNRMEETKKSFNEGLYLTGDLGFFNSGELYVTGRKKDMIIISGKNIYPQDIENEVSSIDGVKAGRVVAFGKYDENRGTEKLIVLVEQSSNNDKNELLVRIRKQILGLGYSTDFVGIVENNWLVKSTAGKISRVLCKEKYENQFEK